MNSIDTIKLGNSQFPSIGIGIGMGIGIGIDHARASNS